MVGEGVGITRVYFEGPFRQTDRPRVSCLCSVLLAGCPAIGVRQVAPAHVALGCQFGGLFKHANRFRMMAREKTGLGQGVAWILLQSSLEKDGDVVSVLRLMGTLQVARPLHTRSRKR